MPRPHRELVPGGWYHVMNRGLCRKNIFESDLDRRRLLDLLAESFRRHGVELHAYCLMGNHYHLMVRCRHGNLDKAMHLAMSMYVREFNRKHDRDGPMFRGRYHAILIESDAYLMTCSRYIHRNPVDFGITDLAAYPWSSYGIYAGRRRCPKLLSTEFLRDLFGHKRAYRAFVEGPFDSEIDEYLGSDNPPLRLGPGHSQPLAS